MTHPDTPLNPDTTYLYKVQAIDNAMNGGPLSIVDLATTTIFTDDPLQFGITKVRAVHITDARTAVNAVRIAAGLQAYPFTDASVAGKPLKAVPLQELRTALNEARDKIAGLSLATFTYPATADTIVRAADLTEIRDGVK